MNDLRVIPAQRHIEAPSVTPQQIDELVEQFYAAVRLEPRLGQLFNDHMSGNWDTHLARMKSFWRSVLLKTGEYKGQPVPAHRQISNLQESDFILWLAHFDRIADDVMQPDGAQVAKKKARMIASSLFFATCATPMCKAPQWHNT